MFLGLITIPFLCFRSRIVLYGLILVDVHVVLPQTLYCLLDFVYVNTCPVLRLCLFSCETGQMGDLQATVEFLVELYKFYNVDLFIRG